MTLRYRAGVDLRDPSVTRPDPIAPARDTAGQERFRTITTAYYRGAMGILLVYDITSDKSFDNIKNWIRNIEEHASADVEKMILGNKCDMNDKRQVRPGMVRDDNVGRVNRPSKDGSAVDVGSAR